MSGAAMGGVGSGPRGPEIRAERQAMSPDITAILTKLGIDPSVLQRSVGVPGDGSSLVGAYGGPWMKMLEPGGGLKVGPRQPKMEYERVKKKRGGYKNVPTIDGQRVKPGMRGEIGKVLEGAKKAYEGREKPTPTLTKPDESGQVSPETISPAPVKKPKMMKAGRGKMEY